MSHEETVFTPGAIVAERYEIVEELGRGSYGVVFRAIQLGIGRDVAIKTLLPETGVGSEEQQRFEREALLISRLNHPNIVTLFDYGEYEGVLFMAMEYVDGRNLGEVIKSEAPLTPSRTRALIYQMLDALQFAHDQGVVHRDLKPENIQLLRNPLMEAEEPDALKVLDFGIAKFVHGAADGSPLDSLTQGGIAMGTPQYMSPENITGDPVSHHADLYAVGLLLYEMLTGEPAFSAGSPQDVMVAHIRDDAPLLPDDPELQPFVRAVAMALQKQPDDRVQSARELREILSEDFPQEVVSKAEEPRTVVETATESERLLTPLVAVVAAAAIVLFLISMVVIQGDSGPETDLKAEAEAEVSGQAATVDQDSEHGSRSGDSGDSGEEEEPQDMVFEIDEAEQSDSEVEPEVVDSALEEASPSPEILEPTPQREEIVAEEVEEVEELKVEETAADTEEVEAQKVEEESQTVELYVVTEPREARVTIDGRPVGTSPLTEVVTRGDEPLRIGFSMMGYSDTVQDVVPDADQTVEVRLERGRLQLD